MTISERLSESGDAPPEPDPQESGPSEEKAIRILDDPHLAAACSAAVDSLEIAAQLESSGLSSQVAVDSFGYDDVFCLAASLYARTPFRSRNPDPEPLPVPGGVRDLLRGVLYAAPTVLFSSALVGFAVRPSWWVIPLGLTCSWGLSQVTAVLGWALRGRGDARSDAFVAIVSLVATAMVTAGLAVSVVAIFSGTRVDVAAAVALALYIAMSGVLLLQDQELLLAIGLAPGAAGVLLSHIGSKSPFSHQTGAWAVVGTLGVVTLAANRHALSRRWRRPAFTRQEWRRAWQYLGHGLCCGTLASVFIGFGAASHARGDALAIAVWPLLLSLGLMEWQLRTFRSQGTRALAGANDFPQFAGMAVRAFGRSFAAYLGLLVTLSVVAEAVGRAHHASMLPLLLSAEGTLGVAFFLGLLLESSGRMDLTLRCWAVAFAVLLGGLLVTYAVKGHISASAGLTACWAASAVAVLAQLNTGLPVLTSPLSY